MKKTVFMTGATGNMGRAGFMELYGRRDRFSIKLLARPGKKNRKLLAPYLDDPSVTVIWGDLMNYDDVLKGVSGADYVLHVGGMVSPQADYYPDKTIKVNVAAAENVVKAILAQRNGNDIKAVYIGSVAQCGDRLRPIHWGRTGDPVYASRYDAYSVSKCLAEKVFTDSGLKWWVSLRQSGILYPGILKQINPIAFHVPVQGMLEWTTIEDSGRLLAAVCGDGVPDEFWNRFYNISSGEQYRMTNYEFEQRVFRILGISSVEKCFRPEWFAKRNFHGMWYTDADRLENYLHFRENLPVDEYFRRMSAGIPWYFHMAGIVPPVIIRSVLRRYAYAKSLGTQDWVRNDPEKLKAFYGSEDEYRAIKSWSDIRPPYVEKNLEKAEETGDVVTLNHGYDTEKSIYSLSLEEIQAAAGFRGGRFIGPEDSIGRKGTVFEWECENGHRFKASLEYVLLGGGWCTSCDIGDIAGCSTGKNRFISQILSSQCLE